MQLELESNECYDNEIQVGRICFPLDASNERQRENGEKNISDAKSLMLESV